MKAKELLSQKQYMLDGIHQNKKNFYVHLWKKSKLLEEFIMMI